MLPGGGRGGRRRRRGCRVRAGRRGRREPGGRRPVASSRAEAAAVAGVVAGADAVGAVVARKVLPAPSATSSAAIRRRRRPDAVADFDGSNGETAPPIAHSEHVIAVEPQVTQPEPRAELQVEAPAWLEPAPAIAEEEPASDDKAARRRSTVREKVSFLSSSPSRARALAAQASEPVAAPAPEPAPQETSETPAAPRRAGWWSRRFGGGA